MNFPYVYVGCGYFRRHAMPYGQPAPILHGMEAVKQAVARSKIQLENGLPKYRDYFLVEEVVGAKEIWKAYPDYQPDELFCETDCLIKCLQRIDEGYEFHGQ